MRAIRQTIEVSGRGVPVRIWGLFDLHVGSALFDESLLRQTVKTIQADDNAYWIGGGDYCEWINRRDPRFNPTLLPNWLQGAPDLAARQRSYMLDIVRPIKHKCLGLLKGNHEVSIWRHYERDVYARMVEEMNNGRDLALGYQGFLVLRLVLGRKVRCIVFYLHHGFGGGRKAGSKALNLADLQTHYDFDVAFMGHTHWKMVLPNATPRVAPTLAAKPKVKEIEQRAAFCGSYLHSFDPDGLVEQYGESAGHSPLGRGSMYAEIAAFCGKSESVRIRLHEG